MDYYQNIRTKGYINLNCLKQCELYTINKNFLQFRSKTRNILKLLYNTIFLNFSSVCLFNM